MKIVVTITKEELKKIVIEHISKNFDNSKAFDSRLVKIETKSQQNYKSEWEEADYRAIYQGDI